MLVAFLREMWGVVGCVLERAVRVTGQSWDSHGVWSQREREREREREKDDKMTRFEMKAPSMSTLPVDAGSAHQGQEKGVGGEEACRAMNAVGQRMWGAGLMYFSR